MSGKKETVLCWVKKIAGNYNPATAAFVIRVAVLCLIAVYVATFDDFQAAHAGELPFEDALTKIRESLSGPLPTTLALAGIIVAGATLIFGGDMNGFFRTMCLIALVLSLLLCANKLMTTLYSNADAKMDSKGATISCLQDADADTEKGMD